MLLRKHEASVYSGEQLGFCHLSVRQFLLKLDSYITGGKKVIIKIVVNEAYILENSPTNYPQRIDKSLEIFSQYIHPLRLYFQSKQGLFYKYLFISL